MATLKVKDTEFHPRSYVEERTVPVDTLEEQLPYSIKLSFEPIIKYWEEKIDSSAVDEKIIAREIFKRLDEIPEFRFPIEDNQFLVEHQETVELLLSSFFSSIQRKRNFGAANRPFALKSFYSTPALRELTNTGKLNICFGSNQSLDNISRNTVKLCSLILNKYYGQKIEVEDSFIYSIEVEGKSNLKYYKSDALFDFVEIVRLKPLKKLSKTQLNQMLANPEDEELWLKNMPPENFEFQGLSMVQLLDITEEETLSRMKYKLLEQDAIVQHENILRIEKDLRVYFDIPSLKLGITAIDYPSEHTADHNYKIRFNFLADLHESLIWGDNKRSIYKKACRNKEVIVIEDIDRLPTQTNITRDLLSLGINSILIAPLVNKSNQVIGMIEIGAEQSFDLTNFDRVKFETIIPLFATSLQRSREEIDNKIEAILREEYTALHASVEWKFVEGAFKIMEKREEDPDFSDPEPIVFKDVYPLYGQADIVGSSNHRNLSIQADLLKNLRLVNEVIKFTQKNIPFPLLDSKLLKVEKYVESLKDDGITSDVETELVNLLQVEIHPLLHQLKNRNSEVGEKVDEYFDKLDSKLGIIYQDRKKYEMSVQTINEVISTCMIEAEKKSQKMIPHYYNEYKTDGVEYNIYVGQALLNNGTFSEIHLHNLRLWQLMSMVEITQKIDNLQTKLPIPLHTAQLIFVYNNFLSIRFRLDEKRFDVDGAYNVRYEIIKKRIDKATIEGTDERLTVKDKIAIVYTSEKDKNEYLGYLSYLRDRNFIEDEIEDLSLNKMQGVEGLKALRVKVNLKTKTK